MWGDIIIAFLLAFITAYVITPYTMRLAKKTGAIDIPCERRINKKPMPRLGGVAVIIRIHCISNIFTSINGNRRWIWTNGACHKNYWFFY